jgi:hypothetical protein
VIRALMNTVLTDAIAAGTRLEIQARRRVEKNTAWLLHAYNLPTAGDMRRVQGQLSALEARMRDLSEQLEER